MKINDWTGQAGDSWAAEWKRTDRSFGMLTEELLRRSRDFSFNQVLDVGCGAGELAMALARGRQQVEVVGVDISPSLIAVARERARNLANLTFVEADAATWRPEQGFTPQLLISRHGVMFFDDPKAAFANLAAGADRDAGLLFSCFRAVSENPFYSEVVRLLPDPPTPAAPGAPGPFAFASADHVRDVLTRGGWSMVEISPYDFPMVVGAGTDPVRDSLEYFVSIGPAAIAAREMELDAREWFFDRVLALARRHFRDGLVALPAAAWIVTARKVR